MYSLAVKRRGVKGREVSDEAGIRRKVRNSHAEKNGSDIGQESGIKEVREA